MEKVVYPADFAKSCSNCKFCDTVTNTAQASVAMFCRRNAPSSQGTPIGMDPNTKAVQWSYTTLWPMVSPQDWCGEHMRKLAS